MGTTKPEPRVADDPERGDPGRLVAYLDGELDPAERARVEAWLEREPAARREAVELQRVWELLDTLPVTGVNWALTERTRQGLRLEGLPGRGRVFRAWLVFLSLMAVAAWVGWRWGKQMAPPAGMATEPAVGGATTEQTYQRVGSWEFLQALDRSGAFAEDEP
ncbi:MAG: hypothetical protein KatS3mg108_0572 [Isosphaeraceae bacterium]|nr:MAG: hypothetical protein KatS3mg108_0572 [Isosphaeraceae bacterium]